MASEISISLDSCPIWILDTETTVRDAGKFSANPHCPDNTIVYLGLMSSDGDSKVILPQDSLGVDIYSPPKLLVGQNIKFDLHYLNKYENLRDFFLTPDTKYWDVGVVHYLLTGMVYRFPSLDQICEFHDLPQKPNEIAMMWAEGVQTEDIDRDLMEEYLSHDLDVTRRIFHIQMELVHERNMMELVQLEMDALAVTFNIERQGLRCESPRFNADQLCLEFELEDLAKDFERKTDMNINSSLEVSAYFFGGTIKREETETIGVYKTGKRKGWPKTRKKVVEMKVPGIFQPEEYTKKTKNENIYVIDNDVLSSLEHPYADMVLEYRDKLKTLSTYYKGYTEWIQDDRIHPTYNHVATATGRLSCTRPNLQNTKN